jgi:hypothetical protein
MSLWHNRLYLFYMLREELALKSPISDFSVLYNNVYFFCKEAILLYDDVYIGP